MLARLENVPSLEITYLLEDVSAIYARTSTPTTSFSLHIFKSSKPKAYPDAISCPCCNAKFTKISELLQHIETPKCSASYETSSIAALMKDLRKETSKAFYDSAFKELKVNYQLQYDASHSSKLPVRVRGSEDEDSKPYQMIPGGQMIPKGVKSLRATMQQEMNR